MIHKPISAERIEMLRGKMKQNIGWTDEELDQITPDNWRLVDGEHKLRRYKMIAEVVKVNDHCELNPKMGDKYVFNGAGLLIPEETTFPRVCMWALSGIFPITLMVVDRILAGLDPNEMWRNQAKCMDLSLRSGGLGEVIFKVYCEEVPR